MNVAGLVALGSIAIEQIGQSIVLKRDYYTTGSTFGEYVNVSGTLSVIKGIIQPVDPKDVDSSAGQLKIGDYYGFFHPEHNVAGSAILISGSDYRSDLLQYPSGNQWYEIVGGANEWVGAGSIFTSLVIRRIVQ